MRLLPKNPLFRLLIVSWLHGLGITVFFEAALLSANIGGLLSIILASSQPLLALGLVFFGLLVTFTSVSMGAAVITLPYGDDR